MLPYKLFNTESGLSNPRTKQVKIEHNGRLSFLRLERDSNQLSWNNFSPVYIAIDAMSDHDTNEPSQA